MKTFIEYDNRTGEVLKALFQREEAALLGLGPNSSLQEVDEDSFKLASSKECYFFEDTLYELPTKPAKGFTFNYDSKQWEDSRVLAEVQDSHWEELKQKRVDLEFGGFTFQGKAFDSDLISQGRILAAASLGHETDWTLADNTTVLLSGEDLEYLVAALAQHVTTLHARGKIARDAIYASTTIDEVLAVEF